MSVPIYFWTYGLKKKSMLERQQFPKPSPCILYAPYSTGAQFS